MIKETDDQYLPHLTHISQIFKNKQQLQPGVPAVRLKVTACIHSIPYLREW